MLDLQQTDYIARVEEIVGMKMCASISC
jgi:hypothetical protein